MKDMAEDIIVMRQTEYEQEEGTLSEAKLALAEMRAALAAADARLDERLEEIVILTDMVLEAEKAAEGNGTSAEDRRKLDERFNEIALLSGFLREQEQAAKVAEDHAQWLRDLHLVLLACPRWWNIMPKTWQVRKRDARVKSKGLFDGPAYLARYPDVEQAGMHPLRHYIAHGQTEGRKR